MKITRLVIEAIHRAADMELILVSVAKLTVEQPQDLRIEDQWEENGPEGIAYFISWSAPAPQDFALKIADAVKGRPLSAEAVAQICRTAEILAFDPAEAARWPYKVVFDRDAEPHPLLALDNTHTRESI